MDVKELQCALEAVLFASGDSVSETKLCTVFGLDREELEAVAQELADYYDYERRGMKLIRLENAYQLCSRADYVDQVRATLEARRVPTLSPSSLEVLAIIAYKQPVTKTYIEQVRGVDSSYTVNQLAEKGLIEDCGRLDVPGRPILYRTTENFLRSFGLSSLNDLPELAELLNENTEQMTMNLSVLPQSAERTGEPEQTMTGA